MSTVKATLKGKAEEKIPAELPEYRGLCLWCETAPGCTYFRDPNRPVLMCEEFVGYTKFKHNTTTKGSTEVTKLKPKDKPEEEDSVAYRGLCANCQMRHRCTFAKPEEGVWHCQEYL